MEGAETGCNGQKCPLRDRRPPVTVIFVRYKQKSGEHRLIFCSCGHS
jgi:hypothetical protein